MRGSWRRFDFWLLGATLLLVVFGIAMVYSATLGVPTYESYPLRQVIYAGIGLLILLAAATFDYRLLTSLQWPIYGIILAILLAVAILGQVRGGTSGWFNAGVIFIQPAEISKVLFAIVFAHRYVGFGRIGDAQHGILEGQVHVAQFGVQRLDLGADGAHLFLERVDILRLLLPVQLADALGAGVAFGAQRLDARQNLAAALIQFQGNGPGRVGVVQLLHGLGQGSAVLAHPTNIEHDFLLAV